MNTRIQQIMDYDGLNAAQFSKKVNINASSLSHLLSGRNMPSYDAIIKIINSYPELSVEWLIKGEGSMLKDESMVKSPSLSSQAFESSLFDNESLPEAEYAKENALKKPIYIAKKAENQSDKPQNETTPRIRKVVIFYTDNTYQEFFA